MGQFKKIFPQSEVKNLKNENSAYNMVHGSLMGFRNRADTMNLFGGNGLI